MPKRHRLRVARGAKPCLGHNGEEYIRQHLTEMPPSLPNLPEVPKDASCREPQRAQSSMGSRFHSESGNSLPPGRVSFWRGH